MDVEEKSEQIMQCAVNGDIGLYTTLVHAFKGASRSIGATEFGDFAARMETAARSGDTRMIAGETGAFLASAYGLIGSIRNALQREDSSGRQEGQEGENLTRSQLEALRSALANMDIAMVNRLVLEYAALPLSKNAKKALSDIENHVLLFDYDKALETMDALSR
jgi:HPt (histidine-containing phosphotransfer) domain-containing protein